MVHEIVVITRTTVFDVDTQYHRHLQQMASAYKLSYPNEPLVVDRIWDVVFPYAFVAANKACWLYGVGKSFWIAQLHYIVTIPCNAYMPYLAATAVNEYEEVLSRARGVMHEVVTNTSLDQLVDEAIFGPSVNPNLLKIKIRSDVI
jgi:hypothetical protein